MSNGNELDRLFKLWAKVSMMVVDGKRDATSVADVLQSILDKVPILDSSTFIGSGTKYIRVCDQRSATLGLLNDYNQVTLSTDWLQGGDTVDGNTRHRRILEGSPVPLNCNHFLDLWINKDKIPDKWKNVNCVTFDGDILRASAGEYPYKWVLLLFWSNGKWNWKSVWMDYDEWTADSPSAVLAV